jgi:glycosyltransferase involved in cell wall biosynthesis
MAVVRVDYTNVGRRASGIERMAIEQFNSTVLAPLTIKPFGARGGRLQITAAQNLALPFCALTNPSDVFVFPCFPPSPYFALARDRAVLYVHDLFLLTRADLNRAAKYYMAPLFSLAIKTLRYFFTNSLETTRQLQSRCHPSSTVLPYRPWIRNVFDLAPGNRTARPAKPARLSAIAIGTVEPRKNLLAAADICDALAARLNCQVDLHIVGRFGWGDDADRLRQRPSVVLHGPLADGEIAPIVEAADIFLCTSHEEGLGRPPLEAQYSGLPIVVPDDTVFHEVLGNSGIFIDPGAPQAAAERITAALADPSWRTHYAALSLGNVARWNAIAENDRGEAVRFLSRLCRTAGGQ